MLSFQVHVETGQIQGYNSLKKFQTIYHAKHKAS